MQACLRVFLRTIFELCFPRVFSSLDASLQIFLSPFIFVSVFFMCVNDGLPHTVHSV